MRLRFYESTHRGVHAACNIKLGDTLFFMPHDEIITVDWACETPIGAQMKEAGLLDDGSMNYTLHNFMATLLLTEIYRKRKDPEYISRIEKWLKILPENTLDFPVCFT